MPCLKLVDSIEGICRIIFISFDLNKYNLLQHYRINRFRKGTLLLCVLFCLCSCLNSYGKGNEPTEEFIKEKINGYFEALNSRNITSFKQTLADVSSKQPDMVDGQFKLLTSRKGLGTIKYFGQEIDSINESKTISEYSFVKVYVKVQDRILVPSNKNDYQLVRKLNGAHNESTVMGFDPDELHPSVFHGLRYYQKEESGNFYSSSGTIQFLFYKRKKESKWNVITYSDQVFPLFSKMIPLKVFMEYESLSIKKPARTISDLKKYGESLVQDLLKMNQKDEMRSYFDLKSRPYTVRKYSEYDDDPSSFFYYLHIDLKARDETINTMLAVRKNFKSIDQLVSINIAIVRKSPYILVTYKNGTRNAFFEIAVDSTKNGFDLQRVKEEVFAQEFVAIIYQDLLEYESARIPNRKRGAYFTKEEIANIKAQTNYKKFVKNRPYYAFSKSKVNLLGKKINEDSLKGPLWVNSDYEGKCKGLKVQITKPYLSNGKGSFDVLDGSGNVLLTFKEVNFRLAFGDFKEGVATFKIIDKSGKIHYDQQRYGLINTQGEIEVPPSYKEYYKVKTSTKKGLVDISGSRLPEFSNGYAVLYDQDNGFGCVDRDLNFQYELKLTLSPTIIGPANAFGYRQFTKQILDPNGKIIKDVGQKKRLMRFPELSEGFMESDNKSSEIKFYDGKGALVLELPKQDSIYVYTYKWNTNVGVLSYRIPKYYAKFFRWEEFYKDLLTKRLYSFNGSPMTDWLSPEFNFDMDEFVYYDNNWFSERITSSLYNMEGKNVYSCDSCMITNQFSSKGSIKAWDIEENNKTSSLRHITRYGVDVSSEIIGSRQHLMNFNLRDKNVWIKNLKLNFNEQDVLKMYNQLFLKK